ncbi:MAG: enoyl-CoA hydratase [Nitratireductor sp.]|nr:enoyl-CoA hydratase [Nitratireductor sp.]
MGSSELEPLVKIDDRNGLRRITLNDPARRNALSRAMIETLSRALAEAEQDEAVRVVAIAANGPVYCAGHDLKEMTAARNDPDGGRAFYSAVMANCSALMMQIVVHPKPVIAEVQGMATAAGCQLVASCDLAVASEKAHFCTPGVHIGLFCSTPMVALTRNVADKHAMELLLTGDPVPAARAEAMGLVNRVVPHDALAGAVEALAGRIASKSPMTLRTGKLAFYRQKEMTLSQAYEYAAAVMVDNMMRDDAKEGIAAFVERRDPKWPDAGSQAGPDGKTG